MEQNNSSSKKSKKKIILAAQKALALFARWFFMMSLLAALLFCVFVWYRFVWNADWDEAKNKAISASKPNFHLTNPGTKE